MDTPLLMDTVAKGSDRSFKFKLIYGIIVWTVAFACLLESLPNVLEKYSPRLNAYLHSGTPTTESDMDYRVNRLSNAFSTYAALVNAACPEKASFKECRAKLLAARPVLDDMGEQYRAMSAAWTNEKQVQTVPDSCKGPMDQYFSAINGYWTAEDKVLRLFASVDPDSKDSIRASLPQLKALSADEDAATAKLRDTAKAVSDGSPCKNY